MDKITITIDGLGNDAFRDGNANEELARLLMDVANKINQVEDLAQ